MSEIPELDRQAQALRAQGLTYREIGERMGETKQQALRRCNREREREKVRAYKAAHRDELRAYDRRYSEENRATCPKCGHVFGKRSGRKDGTPLKALSLANCPGCIAKRREQVVEWWAEGLTTPEIAERLGWSKGHASREFHCMRSLGYDLPYRYRTGRKFPHLQRASSPSDTREETG